MKWIKRGLIWQPNTELWWQQHYGILPTPEYIEQEHIIRIYFATTCADKYGRISFIDVDADNPSRIIRESVEPILDVGEVGCFDDCGLNPSCIICDEVGNKLLYYIGYQRSNRVPYMLLAGAARWNETLQTWERVQKTPLLERTSDEPCIRSATTIVKEDNLYKMWYVASQRWERMETGLFAGRLLPNYIIKYATSADGLHWAVADGVAIDYEDADEFGFGRPWVTKQGDLYQMWYSIRKRHTSYRIGYAESLDGLHWTRKDNEVGIDVSPDGWDSEMICYPAVLQVANKTYLFYNGNNNGMTGFGYAELAK